MRPPGIAQRRALVMLRRRKLVVAADLPKTVVEQIVRAGWAAFVDGARKPTLTLTPAGEATFPAPKTKPAAQRPKPPRFVEPPKPQAARPPWMADPSLLPKSPPSRALLPERRRRPVDPGIAEGVYDLEGS